MLAVYVAVDAAKSLIAYEPPHQSLVGIRSTHKDWWECSTGIAFMPGSRDATLTPAGTPLWRQSQAMVIYDWSNPHNGAPPVYIRTFGLPGGLRAVGHGATSDEISSPL